MSSADPSARTRALAALLTGPSPDRLAALDVGLIAAAEDHGVAPLLGQTLQSAGLLDTLIPPVRDALRRSLREAMVLDALDRHHMDQTLAALGRAGVDAIVFKGAALALTHYPASWMRPRGDVDILVPFAQAAAAGAVLEAIGCRKAPRPEGQLVTFQARYVGRASGAQFACDLHWRIADPQAFADVIDFETLASAAVPGPSPGQWLAGPVHALLIACIHRVAHHHDADRLLFLYDIDRLATRLSPDQWDAFAAEAVAKKVRAVCARGLDLAARLLGTPVPAAVRARLIGLGPLEPTAHYLTGALRRVDILRSDLEQLAGWRARARLLREHLFPSREYISARYGRGHPLLLPLLYADRIARGAGAWFRPIR